MLGFLEVRKNVSDPHLRPFGTQQNINDAARSISVEIQCRGNDCSKPLTLIDTTWSFTNDSEVAIERLKTIRWVDGVHTMTFRGKDERFLLQHGKPTSRLKDIRGGSWAGTGNKHGLTNR